MIVNLDEAVSLILNQQIVAVPTETVYGLAGDATSEVACKKIYEVKQRPFSNPLIIHVSNLEEAKKYGFFNEDAIKIASTFWPGPITLIVPKRTEEICQTATAGLDTIAIRVPASEIILELINKTAKPLAAPSANPSTRISPTLAEHVNKSFLGKIPVFDGGKTLYGIESTIIDCTIEEPTLLRYGFISEDVIGDLLKKPVRIGMAEGSIKAPGSMKKHYSPICPLRINADKADPYEVAINFGSSNLIGNKNFNLSPTGNLVEAAANLYNLLQRAEEIVISNKLKGIVVTPIPFYQIGFAINDKLERAAVK